MEEQLSLFNDMPIIKRAKKEDFSLGPRSVPIGYSEYIRSPDWKKKREKAFKLLGKKCNRCNSKEFLEVHHVNYKNLYKETKYDVEILCYKCHHHADREREIRTGYNTWLINCYGESAHLYDNEESYEEFLDYINDEFR